ncbi:MAG: hypothetical protein IJR66_05650 [Clostridia bacterium]|nr:hypothetical protein [Clostridia bacterium]
MTIKDIIKISATYLGKNNVLGYLSENSGNYGDAVMQIDNLTRCANLVIGELSASYFPMIKTENKVAENGKVPFSAFSETVTGIENVYDANGDKISYKVKPLFIEVNCPSVAVEYRYLPSNYGLTDVIGYTEKEVSARLIAYGVCSEYSIIERNFDESIAWRNRFNEEIKKLIAPKNATAKKRSWV